MVRVGEGADVEESYSAARLVSATARRHAISRSLLTTWRRAYRAGRLEADAAPGFMPVIVAADAPALPAALGVSVPRERSRIEVVLANGRRIVVGPDVDAAALARVVDVLERR